MIDKININQISDHFDGSSAGKPNHSKVVTSNQADDTLQIDNARLMEQAVNSQPTTDTDAVQKARELIQSGQLDTPANIKEAAANIAKFGV
jgi:hypothetical protein